MVQRIGNGRSRTRHLFSKYFRTKGKISVSKYFASFEIGEKVILKVDPIFQKGLFHKRFQGKRGIVQGKRGNCYVIEIKDGKKKKQIITYPIHIKKGVM
jgi:large subunit ribosomal protein L21e